MSYEYDQYLQQHKTNVKKGLDWMRENIPDVLKGEKEKNYDYNWQIGMDHDSSKTLPDEYAAYDKYFYCGRNRSYRVVQEFRRAWLSHIHRNPHHWQYWVLNNDNPNEGEVILDMPDNYIIEMICDWWSFSWQSGDLTSIFKWYDEHKDYMKLSDRTRFGVESILNMIKTKLEEV